MLELIWLIPLLPLVGVADQRLLRPPHVAAGGGHCWPAPSSARRFLIGAGAVWELAQLARGTTVPRSTLAHLDAAGRRSAAASDIQIALGLRPGPAVGGDAAGRHRRRLPDPRLLRRLHGPRAGLRALLRLHEPVHGDDVHAGAGRQPAGAVRRLGGRRALLLPADRLLLRQAVRRAHRAELRRRRPQGLHRQPHRRLRLPDRHALPDHAAVRHAELPRAGRGASGMRTASGLAADRRSASCCSSAPAASRRRSRCTSGCPTRWPAPRRSRR